MARRRARLRTHYLVAVSLATVLCAGIHNSILVRPSGHGQSLHMADVATKVGTDHPSGEMAMQPAEPPHPPINYKAGFIEKMATSDLPVLKAAAAYLVRKEIETDCDIETAKQQVSWAKHPDGQKHDIGVCLQIRNDAAILDEYIAFHWLQVRVRESKLSGIVEAVLRRNNLANKITLRGRRTPRV